MYSSLSKYSSISNFFSVSFGTHLVLNIFLDIPGFLIADIPNPIAAPINAPLPWPQPNSFIFKYLAMLSPAIANELAAFKGFSALFHPHAIEPIVAPIPAPNSILLLVPILVAFTPKFHAPAVPIPNKALGFVAAINPPAKYFI